jgi:desulfoferrodoxin-like iron-binding protein
MLRPADEAEVKEVKEEGRAAMANQLGKRFQCEKCGTEVLCIKPGDGEVVCCGVPMTLMQPKVLPSAD